MLARARTWRSVLQWLLGLCCLGLAGAGWASAPVPVQLLRDAEGLSLSARLAPELPPDLEAVLLRGVPVHFVWQAEVRQPRWYWSARYLGSVQRVVRVAYQPLTGRWRVSVHSGPVGEAALGTALHQTLDSFADAMAAATAVSRWRLLGAAELPASGALRVDFEFRLDDGLLPRPFQLVAPQTDGWSVLYRQTLRLEAGGA
ncbi:MAG: DUF4390 domain-containing protein [Pseudomonadota bacterium]